MSSGTVIALGFLVLAGLIGFAVFMGGVKLPGQTSVQSQSTTPTPRLSVSPTPSVVVVRPKSGTPFPSQSITPTTLPVEAIPIITE